MSDWYSSEEPEQDVATQEQDSQEEAPQQPDIAALLQEKVAGLERELQDVRGSIRDPADYQREVDEQALSQQIQLAVKTARERIDEAALTGDTAAMAAAYKVLDWATTYGVAQLSERFQASEQRLAAIVAQQESAAYAESQRHRFMVEEPEVFEAADNFAPLFIRDIMARGASYDQARQEVFTALQQLHSKFGFDESIRRMAAAVRQRAQPQTQPQAPQFNQPQPRQQRVVPFPTSVRGQAATQQQPQNRPLSDDPLVLAMGGS